MNKSTNIVSLFLGIRNLSPLLFLANHYVSINPLWIYRFYPYIHVLKGGDETDSTLMDFEFGTTVYVKYPSQQMSACSSIMLTEM